MELNWLEIIPALRMLLSETEPVLLSLEYEGSGCRWRKAAELVSEGMAVDESRVMVIHPEELAEGVPYNIKEKAPDKTEWILVEDAGLISVRREWKATGGRIVVITGGAQGFGAGIAEEMFIQGNAVVIADINDDRGRELAERLNGSMPRTLVEFIRTDVSDPASVEELISGTVRKFGGIDTLISNAGILHAGGLEEMDHPTFDRITGVNYSGYFNCVKYVSRVMKVQHKFRPAYFMDIIQINSKSGLKGSKMNFAYAGSKFGGIGLTQSFALELMPFNIKVNAICPGNWFEGPLWSDPDTGLFRQYLDTGKVPGASTVDDVRNHYERQVPAGRGCRVSDVVKAINYIIVQEYETGQAIPVTGGQQMLS